MPRKKLWIILACLIVCALVVTIVVIVTRNNKPAEHIHAWDEGVVTKESTAADTWIKTYTCRLCGETKTEAVSETNLPYSQGLSFISNGNGTCYLSGIGTCTDTDIRIPPKSPADDIVTSIGEQAFSWCDTLTSVTIPSSVTSIGKYAFSDCYKLTSIIIPDGVTSIGDYALGWCESLTDVTIGNSVTSLGKSMLCWCTALTDITIPEGVTSIGDYAFEWCTALTSITIPNSVTSIGESVFSGCRSLMSLSVANGNSVYHSAGDCIIETESKILIAGCKNSVIPTDGSVTSIGNSAFYYCISLTSIKIPNSVTSIEWNAFYNCNSLTSITIPESVTRIGTYAFSGCTSLTNVTYQGTRAQWYAISKGRYWNSNTGSYTIDCADKDITK